VFRQLPEHERAPSRETKIMKFPTALLPALAILWSGAAQAEDRGVFYAGGTVSDGVSGYAGTVVALPGERLGEGLALRGGVNGGTYRYRTDGTRISAEYAGAEIAAVYQLSGPWGWANVSAGPRVTDTSLKPNDPGNRLRGTRYDLAVQTDGATGNAWRLRWFGSLGVFDETYIAQAGLGRLVDRDNSIRLGVEAAILGDPSYTSGSAGVFGEKALGNGWEARLSGGFSEQAGRSARPYASIAVSRVF
jgi:hypothetical protein